MFILISPGSINENNSDRSIKGMRPLYLKKEITQGFTANDGGQRKGNN